MRATYAALKDYGAKPQKRKPVIRAAKDIVGDMLGKFGFDIIDPFYIHDSRDPLDLMAVTFRIVKTFDRGLPRKMMAKLAWEVNWHCEKVRSVDYKQADTVLKKRFVKGTLSKRVLAPQTNFVDEAIRYLDEQNKVKP